MLARARVGAASLLVLASIACGPRMPDESRARSGLTTHDALIANVERTAEEILAARPPPTQSALLDCRLANPKADCPCKLAREQMLMDRASLTDRLQKLARDTPILGLEVQVTCSADDARQISSLAPSWAGRKAGGREIAEGVDVGDRKLGWGLYQTAWESTSGKFGDGAFHPGIEVASEKALASGRIRVRVLVLLDQWRHPADWPAS